MTRTLRTLTGGYLQTGDECHHLGRAVARHDPFESGVTVEATGASCRLRLPGVLDADGPLDEVVGIPWPWRLLDDRGPDRVPPGFGVETDPDMFAGATLWVGEQEWRVLDGRVVVEAVDIRRRLAFLEVELTAETEAGDRRERFDAWLACRYDGDR